MTQTGVVAEGRLSDWISLGVLASWVPRDAVDEAVGAAGQGAQRKGGKLPPHVMVYFAMALALFAEEDYEESWARLSETLADWGCWDDSQGTVTTGGLAQARPSASTDVRTGVRVIIAATMLGAPLWAVALFTPAESYGMHPGLDYFMTWVVFVLTVGATITFALGSVLTGVSVLASRHQKRSGGQLPPRPMQGSQALEGEQDGRPGDDRILCDAPRDARARHMPDHRGAQRTWRSLTVRRDQHRPANLQVTADA